MNTRIYEYLIAVSELKNITKAAEQCFISQPALTQHIKKLETYYGFPLFKRKENQWIPTRQGEIFLTTAKRILQIEKETYAKIELCKKNKKSAYRIFVDFHIRNVLIECILPEFSKHYPDLKISLISGDTDSAFEYIDNSFIDVAIMPICENPPDTIDYLPVDQNEYLLVLPPKQPDNKKIAANSVDLHELKDETFILNQSFSLFSSMQQQIFERYGIIPQSTLYAHSMQSISRMVSHGQGIAFLPDVIIQLTNLDCTCYSLDPPWYFQHVVAYSKSQGLTACHALLADLLIKHYSQFHT